MSKSFPALFTCLLIPLTMMSSTIRAQQPAGQTNLSRIGRIYIQGNENVPERTIIRLLALYSGQQYRAADLRKAETNLARSNLFTIAKISVPEPNGEYHDIRIDVIESPLGKVVGRIQMLRETCAGAAINVLGAAMGIGYSTTR